MTRAINIMLLLAITLFMPAGHARADDDAHFVADSIDVQGLVSIDRDELLYLLDIAPGTLITQEHVTLGIKRAFLKGIFDSIKVDSDDTGGVSVEISEKSMVERIRVKSNKVRRDDVLDVFGFNRGDRVTGDILDGRIEILKDYLVKRGYPHAEVSVDYVPLDPPINLEINLFIEEGEPEIINSIAVLGRPDREVVSRMALRQGDIFDRYMLQEDLAMIKDYYEGKRFLSPVVGPYEFVDGNLVVSVRLGKSIDYLIKGNDSFLDKEIIRIMPFAQEGKVTDDLVAEAVERVVHFYRDKGYPSVQVAPVVKVLPDSIQVRVYIDEGESHQVRSVRVIKDGQEAAGNILGLINNRKGRQYKPLSLSSDARIISSFYSSLGHKDVRVDEPGVSVEGKYVDIEFPVKPGPRFLIASVDVTGSEGLPTVAVQRRLSIKPGKPFNEVDIIESRRAMRSMCRGYGYVSCEVEIESSFTDEGARLGVNIDKGDKFFFGKTIISGNRLAATESLLLHIQYVEEEPFDMEKVVKTRQRLLGLGLFSSVKASISQVNGRFADIRIDVVEASPGSLDFGIGYGEYEGLRSFVEVGYRNLFGGANSGSLRLEASTLWKRYILNYNEPFFMGYELRSRSFLMREERKQKNIDTDEVVYRVIKNSASTGLEKDLTKRITVSAYYEYSIVDTYDVKPDVILSREDTGTLAISSLTPSIYYNSLNDPLDPSRGGIAGITIKDASGILFSESEFTRVTGQASRYKRLVRRVIGAISLRGGTAEGRGDTTDLPVVERFYLGGRNTVRGFDQDSLGPVGANGLPIGGNHFLLANLEFRIHLGRSWWTVLFSDCGNVWLDKSDVSASDLRCSAGSGIRFKTPVGPVRLDYGYKLDREQGESKDALHFSIGHAF